MPRAWRQRRPADHALGHVDAHVRRTGLIDDVELDVEAPLERDFVHQADLRLEIVDGTDGLLWTPFVLVEGQQSKQGQGQQSDCNNAAETVSEKWSLPRRLYQADSLHSVFVFSSVIFCF